MSRIPRVLALLQSQTGMYKFVTVCIIIAIQMSTGIWLAICVKRNSTIYKILYDGLIFVVGCIGFAVRVICLGIRCGYRESHRKLRPLSCPSRVTGKSGTSLWGTLSVKMGLYSGGGILGCSEDCCGLRWDCDFVERVFG